MKIAVVHEMLIKLGGAEKVVEKLLKIFPKADLFTLIYDEEKVKNIFPKNIINKQVFSLPTQKRYSWIKKQRFCLDLMSRSIEQLDFSKYDIVISSSSGFAHGAITKPETKFIVYSHAPARYMWDWTNEYKKDIGFDSGIKSYLLNKLFLKLRQWDYIASKRADLVIANSSNTAKRIWKYHKNKAEILYPPVEVDRFSEKLNFENKYGDYYIIVSMLAHYKKIEIAIEAFNKMPDKKLLIVGNGDFRGELEKIAKENTVFVGAKYSKDLVGFLQNAKGLVFPGEEDFGIVPVEALACSIPLFAYKGGGLLETNLEGITGEFFQDKNGKDFVENFEKFDKKVKNNFYKKENILTQAKKFGEKEFEKRIKELVFEK